MDAEQLVAEIARQTGIRLSTADPILAAAVINELLLDKVLAKLDRQVQVQADRVTAASTQAVADAKKEAEALLTEAGAWLEARIKTAGEAAAGMALAELRRETEKVEKSKRTIIRGAWAMAVVGLVVLCGLGGMALAALR
jgi:CHASE3 domain sensor protein